MEGPQIQLIERTHVLSVGEFAAGLRAHVERRFSDVWIGGEVSNLRNASSGHCYFSLKDDSAQIRCVMWRSTASTIPFRLQDGMEVHLRGGLTYYEPRGDLQIVVRQLKAAGEGALRQAFEALKQQLAAEGLFDANRKRNLPVYPEHIGIVTSGEGAALQDMLTILRRRYPIARVSVHAVRVQGSGAAEEIAAAVDAFSTLDGTERPDVVIVGRGGGSIEDLWAFNEEVVARAIFRCAVPVVSAVGHETDFAISDFVADLRAATPSNAAELVVPDRIDLVRRIRALHDRAEARHRVRIERLRRRVLHLVNSYVFNRPLDRLSRQQQRVDELHERLRLAVLRQLERRRAVHLALQQRVELLDPRRPMERGYALVEKGGKRVSMASLLKPEDVVTIQFIDGAHGARIEKSTHSS